MHDFVMFSCCITRHRPEISRYTVFSWGSNYGNRLI